MHAPVVVGLTDSGIWSKRRRRGVAEGRQAAPPRQTLAPWVWWWSVQQDLCRAVRCSTSPCLSFVLLSLLPSKLPPLTSTLAGQLAAPWYRHALPMSSLMPPGPVSRRLLTPALAIRARLRLPCSLPRPTLCAPRTSSHSTIPVPQPKRCRSQAPMALSLSSERAPGVQGSHVGMTRCLTVA